MKICVGAGPRGLRGFSLIELMVSLVIGLVLLLGAFQFYSALSSSYSQMRVLGDRQHALRFIVDVLSEDVRAVGRKGVVSNEPDVEGSRLVYKLIYSPSRKSSFYCGAGEDLDALDYVFDPDDGTVGVRPTCDGVVSNGGAISVIVEGIDNFQIVSSPYADVAALIRLSFLELPSEPEGAGSFRYVVANRDAVLGKVEVSTD
ncbi:PilW family protein [Halomonas alkalicola]|uniref:PilW family protein n=1 Tax=Halomonas alkalicola TaxID=1930622 RepID=UPI00265E2DAB|nr:prepilin-type N-terminal cleavage/methylation domain-containing protein [Halomonas alkalicola]